MEYVVALTEALGWPVTVLLLVFFLRKELRGLLARVNRLSYGDIALELSQVRDQVEAEKARQLPPEAVEQVALGYYDRRLDHLLELAEKAPRAAMLEAWTELERSVVKAAQRAQLPEGEGTRELLSQLAQRRVIPASYVGTIDELRRLRNVAAHSLEFDVGASIVREFVDLAVNLAVLITSLSGGSVRTGD